MVLGYIAITYEVIKMRYNCSGKDFLRYAKEELRQDNHETAIYLSCVAEDEASKVGDYETLMKALNFTKKAKNNFRENLKEDLYKYGIAPSSENIRDLMVQRSNLVRVDLRVVLEEFNVEVDGELPENVVSRIEEILMEIPE